MRKLYLDNGNSEFKFADTTTKIILNALDNGIPAELTADTKVRIKNESGYLLDVSANITNGQAVITSEQLAQLPVGRYLIELWDTGNGGTAIYPSAGFLALQINESVTGLSGGIVSSITVDDFIEQFGDLSQQLKKEVADSVANGELGNEIRTQITDTNKNIYEQTKQKLYTVNSDGVQDGYYTEDLQVHDGSSEQGVSHHCIKVNISDYNTLVYETGTLPHANVAWVCIKEDVEPVLLIPMNANFNVYDISKFNYLYMNLFSGEDYCRSFTVSKYKIVSDAIQNEVNTIKNEIDTIQNEVDKKQNAIIKYHSLVRKPLVFAGKTAVFVGDSITYGVTKAVPDYTDVHGIGDFPTLFSNIVGLNATNSGISGALFTSGYNEVTTIKEQIENTNKNVDFLFIAGGINDWQMGVPIETFESTIKTCCDYINANFASNVKVIWITPINEAGWHSSSERHGTVQDYRNSITRVVTENDTYSRFSIVQGNEFNFPSEDDDNNFIATAFGDKLHPSAIGYKDIYVPCLLNKLC